MGKVIIFLMLISMRATATTPGISVLPLAASDASGIKKNAVVLVLGGGAVDYSNLRISARPETEAYEEVFSKKKKYTLVSISNDGKTIEERKLDFSKTTNYIKCATLDCIDHFDTLMLRVFLKNSPEVSKVRLLQRGKLIMEVAVQK
jgi:hypothetical protein